MAIVADLDVNPQNKHTNKYLKNELWNITPPPPPPPTHTHTYSKHTNKIEKKKTCLQQAKATAWTAVQSDQSWLSSWKELQALGSLSDCAAKTDKAVDVQADPSQCCYVLCPKS